jgi:hypothetical protein
LELRSAARALPTAACAASTLAWKICGSMRAINLRLRGGLPSRKRGYAIGYP